MGVDVMSGLLTDWDDTLLLYLETRDGLTKKSLNPQDNKTLDLCLVNTSNERTSTEFELW